jgi:hypothetical protein
MCWWFVSRQTTLLRSRSSRWQSRNGSLQTAALLVSGVQSRFAICDYGAKYTSGLEGPRWCQTIVLKLKRLVLSQSQTKKPKRGKNSQPLLLVFMLQKTGGLPAHAAIMRNEITTIT